jgi:hypothetical protein
MLSRRLVCLVLVFLVFLLSVCLIPVGHGPFAAAYGPAAKFQALKTLFLLVFLMSAAVKFSKIFCSAGLLASGRLTSRKDSVQITPYQLSLNSALRC